MDFEDIIRSARYEYKKVVDADDWNPGPGSATPATEPTLPAGYQAALPTEPMVFQTMTCQDIYTSVATAMYASTQATSSPTKDGYGRVGRGG